jgi:hypothetical protein
MTASGDAIPDGPSLVSYYLDARGRYVVPSARVHALARYARDLENAAHDVVDWSAKSSPYEAERFADAMAALRTVLADRHTAPAPTEGE